MANYFQDAIHNRWETVATRLPGKTPGQLLEAMAPVADMLESPPQPSSQPLPQPWLQSQHQTKSQTDISNLTDKFFSNIWGYQPPLELIAELGGHQPLQSQPQPQETVATRLPGKTPAQLQDFFLKLMTNVNAIKNGYPENMIIMIPVPATPLENSLLSIPIVNATPPPPPPHWTHRQHHRMEEMAPIADMAVPMHITLSSSVMSEATREQN
ncbi:hypothetical protein AHAS_Ahas17G0226100 [Arachis hypogaea]